MDRVQEEHGHEQAVPGGRGDGAAPAGSPQNELAAEAARGQAAVAAEALPRTPAPDSSAPFFVRAMHGYSSVVCNFLIATGALFILHAVQAMVLIDSQLIFGDGANDLKKSATMLFGNFAMPFSESAALLFASGQPRPEAAIPEMMSVGVWGFWMPLLLGGVLMCYGGCGRISMRLPHPVFAMPFALLAVVFLMWQVEVSKMLSQVAYEEEFKFKSEQTKLEPLQMMHYELYKVGYEKFSEALAEQHCNLKVISDPDKPISLDCKGQDIEARLMEVVLPEICRAHAFDAGAVKDFSRRIEVCKIQGRQLKILPEKSFAREDAFCICRSVVYDWLQVISKSSMVIWFGKLLGVCGVLYFIVEPNLSRLSAKERREIHFFSILGLLGLICRVFLVDDTLSGRWQAALK